MRRAPSRAVTVAVARHRAAGCECDAERRQQERRCDNHIREDENQFAAHLRALLPIVAERARMRQLDLPSSFFMAEIEVHRGGDDQREHHRNQYAADHSNG